MGNPLESRGESVAKHRRGGQDAPLGFCSVSASPTPKGTVLPLGVTAPELGPGVWLSPTVAESAGQCACGGRGMGGWGREELRDGWLLYSHEAETFMGSQPCAQQRLLGLGAIPLRTPQERHLHGNRPPRLSP